jgi:hypothetical protein
VYIARHVKALTLSAASPSDGEDFRAIVGWQTSFDCHLRHKSRTFQGTGVLLVHDADLTMHWLSTLAVPTIVPLLSENSGSMGVIPLKDDD